MKGNMYRQFTCIDRWDDNAQYFDPLLEEIEQGNADKVVEEMKTWREGDLESYSYEDVTNGKANNSGEEVVYDDGLHILTASAETITLFQKILIMEQKEYHNYPIGSLIYPRDNSQQELLETTDEWDGVDHSSDLYHKECVVCSDEYKFKPDCCYYTEEEDFVNVKYLGGIYRVIISKYWDMSKKPDWTEIDLAAWDD